jgi:hypothetical protein
MSRTKQSDKEKELKQKNQQAILNNDDQALEPKEGDLELFEKLIDKAVGK